MAPPTNTDSLGEVLEFMRLVWGLDHGLQTASKRMNASLGITGPQRLVVRLVGRFPGITAGKLAELQRVHPSTLTGVLVRLQERGIVERQTDPKDHRRIHLYLTQRGIEFDAVSEGTVEAAVRTVLSRANPSDVAGARAILRALGQELTGEDDEVPLEPAPDSPRP